MKTKTSKETAPGKTSFFLNLSMEEKISLGILALILFTIVAIRSNFAGIGFERDEGAYSYYGKLLLEGKTPYVDFYEQKFPGIFYFYGLMVSLFGFTVQGLHAGFMYLNMLTVILIYATARKLFSPFAGVIAAITYAFVSIAPNLSGFTIQSEHGVSFFISLGLLFYALYREKGTWYQLFLMGLSFGMAFMTKTNGVFLVLWGGGTLILDYLFDKKRSFKTLLINIGIYGAGGLLVIVLLFLLILIKGSFSEMIFWAYEVPKNYVGKIKFSDGVQYFKFSRDNIVANYTFFWIHALLGLGVCLLKSVDFKDKLIFLSLGLFSFLTIVPGFYFYGHYWIQLIPGLAILSALAFHGLTRFLKNTLNLKQASLPYIYLGIFVILTVRHTSALRTYYFHPNYDRVLRSVYGNNPFPETVEVANFINANSGPEDQTALLGSEPQFFIYTQKNYLSRHAYFAAIVADFKEHPQWQRELAADIEKASPRYVVFYNHGISLFVQPNTDKYIFEWANKYITEGYHLVGLADMVDGLPTNYVWKEALAGYQPKGQNIIYVYEKNAAPAPEAAAQPEPQPQS
jgi:4-amino-4-deoxy-L-arabinose transferase-like glycosyltransferase